MKRDISPVFDDRPTTIESRDLEKIEVKEPVVMRVEGVQETKGMLHFVFNGIAPKLVGDWIKFDERQLDAVSEPTALFIGKLLEPLRKFNEFFRFVGSWSVVIAEKFKAYGEYKQKQETQPDQKKESTFRRLLG